MMDEMPLSYNHLRYHYDGPQTLSTKERRLAIMSAVAAALPKGDKWHEAEAKWRAIKKVVEDGRSYRSVAEEESASVSTVVRWVSDFEWHLLNAKIHVTPLNRT